MNRDIGKDFEERNGWLVNPIIAINRDTAQLFTSPDTAMVKVRQLTEQAFQLRLQQVGERDVLEDLLGAWIPVDMWERVPVRANRRYRKFRSIIGRRPIGQMVLSLVDAAHGAVPYSPLMANAEPVERGRSVLVTYGQRIEIRYYRGEERARKLWHLLVGVAENVYRPYLDQVWRLQMYAARRVPPAPPRFGALVRALAESFQSVPLLVEPDAAHARNAVSHREGAKYDATTKTSRLSNANGWAREFSSHELMTFVRGMLDAEETLYRTISEFTIWSMATTLWPAMRDLGAALRTNDESAIAIAAQSMDVRSNDLLGHISSFHAIAR